MFQSQVTVILFDLRNTFDEVHHNLVDTFPGYDFITETVALKIFTSLLRTTKLL